MIPPGEIGELGVDVVVTIVEPAPPGPCRTGVRGEEGWRRYVDDEDMDDDNDVTTSPHEPKLALLSSLLPPTLPQLTVLVLLHLSPLSPAGLPMPAYTSSPSSRCRWTFSMMYFPSLYFWLISYARLYVHPMSVRHRLHDMSDTVCKPVISIRSSDGPVITFTH